MVDIDQVSNVKLTRSGSRYNFDAKVKLDRFQEVRLVSAVEQDQDLYFYLISQFSLFPKQGVHESFVNLEMRMKDKNTQLYLISGQNINVKDPNHPEEDHIEVKNYEKRRKLSVK